MRAMSNALPIGLAVLVLCLYRFVSLVNKRLLSGGQILGGRLQPRGLQSFPFDRNTRIRDGEKEPSRLAMEPNRFVSSRLGSYLVVEFNGLAIIFRSPGPS